jgi:hypothetical protein
MKRITVLTKLTLPFLVCLSMFGAGSSAEGRNRCKDRCADRARLEKDACKAIPLKHERHSCEDAVKHHKKECKRRCG